MNIRQSDTLTFFQVQSDSHPNVWYTVDLLAYWTNGQCDCPDFRIRMEPELRKGKPKNMRWWCKHIRSCRAQLSEYLINTMLQMEYDKAHPKTHPEDQPHHG